jgi:hypothetical protein
MASVIYHSNDNIVTLTSLLNGYTAAAATGATVTLSLLTATGAVVSGASGISMVATSGAASTYRGTLPYSLSLTTGGTYTAKIIATHGTVRGQWEEPVRIVERTG